MYEKNANFSDLKFILMKLSFLLETSIKKNRLSL
jgi:hypothetical protein